MPVFKLTYSALTDLLIYKNLVILLLFVVLDEEKERGEPLRLLAPLLEHLLQILTECTVACSIEEALLPLFSTDYRLLLLQTTRS